MLSIANPGRASITAKKITVSTASTAIPWQAVDRPRTFSASLTPCPRVPHHFPTPLAAAADAAVAVIANLYLLLACTGLLAGTAHLSITSATRSCGSARAWIIFHNLYKMPGFCLARKRHGMRFAGTFRGLVKKDARTHAVFN